MKVLSVDRHVIIAELDPDEWWQLQGHSNRVGGTSPERGAVLDISIFALAIRTLREERERLERLRATFQSEADRLEKMLETIDLPSLDT